MESVIRVRHASSMSSGTLSCSLLTSTFLEVHVDATEENNHSFETTKAAQKLMHRFSEQQVESAMDKAVKSSG